jgi:hypothetical protein
MLKMPGFADVFRALKHHMFKQMRKTGPTFALVARADIVINRDGDDRNRRS